MSRDRYRRSIGSKLEPFLRAFPDERAGGLANPEALRDERPSELQQLVFHRPLLLGTVRSPAAVQRRQAGYRRCRP